MKVKELTGHISDDMKNIIDDMDIETLLMMQPACMEGLIEDLKHKISILWLSASSLEVIVNALQWGIAKEAQKVEIQNP